MAISGSTVAHKSTPKTPPNRLRLRVPKSTKKAKRAFANFTPISYGRTKNTDPRRHSGFRQVGPDALVRRCRQMAGGRGVDHGDLSEDHRMEGSRGGIGANSRGSTRI